MSSREKSQGIARAKRPAVVAASAGAGPVVAVDAVVARTPAGLLVRSEGQRLLIALSESSAEIGRRIGKSKQIVASYRSGGATPSPEVRRALEKAFPEVRAHAWSDRPSEAADEAQAGSFEHVAGPNELAVRGTLGELNALIETVRQTRKDPKAINAEKIKCMQLEESLLARKAKLEREAVAADDMLEEHWVHTDRWLRFERVLTGALKKHPGASEALLEALEKLHGGTL